MKDLIHNLDQFDFVHQRIGTYHISVTLIKFAVTSFLRTVSTPYRLYLVTLERESDIITVLHTINGTKGTGQVNQS